MSQTKICPCRGWVPDTITLHDLVFSGWDFAGLVFSAYLSRHECPRESRAVASAPCSTEPRMHSCFKPL